MHYLAILTKVVQISFQLWIECILESSDTVRYNHLFLSSSCFAVKAILSLPRHVKQIAGNLLRLSDFCVSGSKYAGESRFLQFSINKLKLKSSLQFTESKSSYSSAQKHTWRLVWLGFYSFINELKSHFNHLLSTFTNEQSGTDNDKT